MQGNNITAPSSIPMLIARQTKKRTKLKNISFAPRRIPLRLGESIATSSESAVRAGNPPAASHSVKPLNASPQREQNFISSEICCWPQLGQYINAQAKWDLVEPLTVRYQVPDCSAHSFLQQNLCLKAQRIAALRLVRRFFTNEARCSKMG